MSGIIIDVKANSEQANRDIGKLNDSLRNIEKTTSSMSTGLKSLAVSFGSVLASGLTVNYLKNVADTFVGINNKIRLVTGTTNQLVTAQRELLKISNTTRSSLEGSAALFSKLGLALQKNGASVGNVLKATESIQKAIALSGASADSAAAAVIQLGQGLSSGTLRGEELNSVLEQTPRVAKAIADGLKISTGQLRLLAANGQITSEKVFSAILSQSEQINKEFSTLTPTLSQGMTQLGTATKVFTNELMKGFSSGGGGLATVFSKLADKILVASDTIASDTTIFLNKLRAGLKIITILANISGGLFSAVGSQFLSALPSIKTVKTLAKDIVSTFETLTAPITKIFTNIFKSMGNAFGDVFNFDTGVEKALSEIRRIEFAFNITTLLKYQVAFQHLSTAIRENSTSIGASVNRFVNSLSSGFDSVLRYVGILPDTLFTFRVGDMGPMVSTIAQVLRSLTGIKVKIWEVSTILSDVFGSTFAPLLNFLSDVLDLTTSKLGKAADYIKNFASDIIEYFRDIYDKVIGHSWWTDTIDGIVNQSEGLLARVKKPFETFKNFIFTLFKEINGTNLLDSLSNVASNLTGGKLSFTTDFNFKDSLNTIKTEFPEAFKTAILASSGLAVAMLFPANAIKTALMTAIMIALATTGSLAAERFGSDLFGGSFITDAANGIGKALGFLVADFIRNIPQLLNALLGIVNGFVQGFLSEMPLLFGTIFKGLFSIANFLGLAGPMGILGSILFGVGVSKLLGNFDTIKTASTKLVAIYSSLSAFVKGEGGLISQGLFGLTGGPVRTLSGLGLILSSLGTFDGLFANSELAHLALNGGLLYLSLFGQRGLETIISKGKSTIASITTNLRDSMSSLAGTSSSMNLLYTLIFGTEQTRGVLFTSIKDSLASKLSELYSFTAKLLVNLTSKSVDVMSTLLFGTDKEAVYKTIKDKLNTLISFISAQLSTFKNNIAKNAKMSAFDTLFRMPNVKNTANDLDTVLTTTFNKLDMRAKKLAGEKGLLGTLFEGKGKTKLILLALAGIALFSGAASASESLNTSLEANVTNTDRLFESFTIFVKDNPIKSFATAAVIAITSITTALDILNKKQLGTTLLSSLGSMGTNAMRGGAIGLQRSARGSAYMAGGAAAIGGYIGYANSAPNASGSEKATNIALGVAGGVFVEQLVTGMLNKLKNGGYASRIAGFLGDGILLGLKWIVVTAVETLAGIAAGFMALSFPMAAAVVGGVTAVTSVLVIGLASLWDSMRNGTSYVKALSDNWDNVRIMTGFSPNRLDRHQQLDASKYTKILPDTKAGNITIGDLGFKQIDQKLLTALDDTQLTKSMTELKTQVDSANKEFALTGELMPATRDAVKASIENVKRDTARAASRTSPELQQSLKNINAVSLPSGSDFPLMRRLQNRINQSRLDKLYNITSSLGESSDDFLIKLQSKKATAYSAMLQKTDPQTETLQKLANGLGDMSSITNQKLKDNVEKAMQAYIDARKDSLIQTDTSGNWFNTSGTKESQKKAQENKKQAFNAAVSALTELDAFAKRERAVKAFNESLTGLQADLAKANITISDNVLFSRDQSSFDKIRGFTTLLAKLQLDLVKTKDFAERNKISIQIETTTRNINNEATSGQNNIPLPESIATLNASTNSGLNDALISKLSTSKQKQILGQLQDLSSVQNTMLNSKLELSPEAKRGYEVYSASVKSALQNSVILSLGRTAIDTSELMGAGRPVSAKGIDARAVSMIKRAKLMNAIEVAAVKGYGNAGELAQLEQQLIQVNRDLNPPVRTFETILQEIGMAGTNASLAQLFYIPKDVRSRLAEIGKEMAAINYELSFEGTDQLSKRSLELAKQSAKLQKEGAALSLKAQPKTLANTFEKLNALGLDMTPAKFDALGGMNSELAKAVETLDLLNLKKNQEGEDQFKLNKLIKIQMDLVDNLKLKYGTYGETAKTVIDMFPTAVITQLEWASATDETKNALIGLTAKYKTLNDQSQLGIGNSLENMNKLRAISDEAEALANNMRSPISLSLARIKKSGGNLSDTGYLNTTETQRNYIDNQARLIEIFQKQLENNTFKDNPALEAQARSIVDQAKKNLALAIEGVSEDKTNLEKYTKAGASLSQSELDRMSGAILEPLVSIRNKILEQMAVLSKADTTNEERAVAQNSIDNLQLGLEQGLAIAKSKTLRVQDTLAWKAGEDLSNTMKDSFANGLKSVLNRTASVKDAILSMAQAYSEAVINSFVDGLTSSLFKAGGTLSTMFKNMGMDVFGKGASLLGGNNEPLIMSNSSLVVAINTLTATMSSATLSNGFAASNILGNNAFMGPPAPTEISADGIAIVASQQLNTDQVISTEQGFFSSLGGVFMKGLTGLGSLLKGAWQGLTSMFSGSSGSGMLGGLFSGISGLFSSGGFETFSNFLQYGPMTLATGGHVSGAGTGTSDSIRALLSNGEFVVNAKATKQNRALLEAINADGIPRFATGGMVDGSAYSALNSAIVQRDANNKTLNTQQSVFNINVTGDISRQTRNEIQAMIPQIAVGVNQNNRESGYR
jgi:tape measure domain-containing protein